MMKSGIFCVVCIGILSFACEGNMVKKTKNPNKVELIADFYIKYETRKSRLQSDCSIKAGEYREHGVNATINGTMSLNGTPFQDRKHKGQHLSYNARKSCPPPQEYSIDMKLDNGKSKSLKFPTMPITDFYLSQSRFSENEAVVISWSGPKLEEEEMIMVYFEDDEGNKQPWKVFGPSDKFKLHIPKDIIYTLKLGKGKAYLTRRKNYKKIEDWLDYSVTTEYYTKLVDFEVYRD